MTTELTTERIDGLRRAWKQIADLMKKARTDMRSVESVYKATEKAENFINLLEQDLLYNTGLWHYPGTVGDGRPLSQERARVVEILDDVMDKVVMARVASRHVLRQYKRGNPVKDHPAIDIDELVREADSTMGRRLFPLLKRMLKKPDFSDIKGMLPDKVDVGGVNLIFREHSQHNPRRWGEEEMYNYKSPVSREAYFKQLTKAQNLLEAKGFGHLWYGDIIVEHEDAGGQLGHGRLVPASYFVEPDHIRIYAHPRREMFRLIIHEMGHRHWFKFMTPRQRRAFAAYFHTGEVEPVTSYGGQSPEEDFAEAFTEYVIGGQMNRDQVERFKQFAGLGGGRIARINMQAIRARVMRRYLGI